MLYMDLSVSELRYAMSDIQGALKEMIVPSGGPVRPWVPQTGRSLGGPQIKRVRQRHKLVVSLHMAGFSDIEIAKELGYSPNRVGIIIKSQNPQLVDYRAQVEDQVAMQMGDLAMSFRAESRASLRTLVQIRDKEDAPLSEKRLSALAILDRAGYSPVKKQINLDASVPLNELKEIVGQLDHANEVYVRRDSWVVKDLPKDSNNG